MNTHLEVSIIGTDDTVRLNSWYGSTPMRIDAFETSGGQTLLSSQVDQLVQAMVAFSPPPPGQIALSQNQSAALTPVLAASWVEGAFSMAGGAAVVTGSGGQGMALAFSGVPMGAEAWPSFTAARSCGLGYWSSSR